MKIVTGNPVRGEDFFGREQKLDEIWETIQGDSVLLAAPRRVGKTSVMFNLLDNPRHGFNVLFLDAQDYSEPEDLVTDLVVKVGKLINRPKQLFKLLLHNVDELGIWQLRVKFKQKLTDRWQDLGEQAVREAIRNKGLLLLIIDELPLLLHKLVTDDPVTGKRKAQALLDWLRHVRHEPTLSTHTRQLLGGSIGLPRIASYLNSTARINDMVSIDLGPLDRDQARELMLRLLASRHVVLAEPLVDVLLDQVDTFLPILLQIMASSIAWEVKRQGVTPNRDLITKVYEERALGSMYRLTFEDYYERLERYYTPADAQAARRILQELANASGGLSRSAVDAIYLDELGEQASLQDLDLLLTWLSDDFYLKQEACGDWAFKSRWIQDWWRRYHAGR